MSVFTESERAQLRASSEEAIREMLAHFLRTKPAPTVGHVFGVMVWQLAFARVLEEQLLACFASCPNRPLAAELEEFSADIARVVMRKLKEAGRD